ncbi:hypothetical protein XENOCAPTIV_018887 [Xenoophorus captivus]|uniref:Uncharacterized protein n=1 Tax=Xenoophorus captivus TaxID=1517983 RepID=A0ABV0S0L9_9TELE
MSGAPKGRSQRHEELLCRALDKHKGVTMSKSNMRLTPPQSCQSEQDTLPGAVCVFNWQLQTLLPLCAAQGVITWFTAAANINTIKIEYRIFQTISRTFFFFFIVRLVLRLIYQYLLTDMHQGLKITVYSRERAL